MPRQNPDSNLSKNAGLEYTVRESPRAKHVNLKMSVQSGLEIVVPRGYDHKKIPQLLLQKGTWLNRTRQRLNQELSHMPAGHFESLPYVIHLPAIDTHYQIEYEKSVNKTLRLRENNAALTLQGKTEDHELCIDLLDTWLRNTARKHLAPWLRRTSHELGLPYNITTIRAQKTRWGSCSSNKTISLNYRLLFLPKVLVHYLFVHELCHTRHMNHSAKYWRLVEEKYSDYRTAEKELKSTSRYLPLWLKE